MANCKLTRLLYSGAQANAADFGSAVESYAAHAADSARDVNPAVHPSLQAGDVSPIDDGRGIQSDHRHDDLPAVRMAAQHQVPLVGIELILAIGIVRQDDRGTFGIRLLESLDSVELFCPQIAKADQLKLGAMASDFAGTVRQETDTALLDHSRHLGGGPEAAC